MKISQRYLAVMFLIIIVLLIVAGGIYLYVNNPSFYRSPNVVSSNNGEITMIADSISGASVAGGGSYDGRKWMEIKLVSVAKPNSNTQYNATFELYDNQDNQGLGKIDTKIANQGDDLYNLFVDKNGEHEIASSWIVDAIGIKPSGYGYAQITVK